MSSKSISYFWYSCLNSFFYLLVWEKLRIFANSIVWWIVDLLPHGNLIYAENKGKDSL